MLPGAGYPFTTRDDRAATTIAQAENFAELRVVSRLQNIP
jgi:hypothetical protein